MPPYQVVLIERTTGADVLGECHLATLDDRRRAPWYGFRWTTFGASVEVLAITVSGSADLEGMVALELCAGWVEVRLLAVAPPNRGRHGRYRIGGALFGLACCRSFELGCDGYVAFDAKTALAPYYAAEYGAQLISRRGAPRMIIETRAAAALVARYVRR